MADAAIKGYYGFSVTRILLRRRNKLLTVWGGSGGVNARIEFVGNEAGELDP